MGILSNFLGFKDGRSADERSSILRPAAPDEVDAALRLVLGGHGTAVSDQHVQEFVGFASDRGIDLQLLWVAEQAGRLTLAVLPVVSAGRTMLLFVSPPPSKASEAIVARLVDCVCHAAAERGVHLAQALIDPSEETMQSIYTDAGFEWMAELIYLQGSAPADTIPPVLPPHFHWVVYTDAMHGAFCDAIIATYHNSLDCPALNGLRDIQDVMDGHKASGVFDPHHWLLLRQADRTIGILLLAASGRNQDVMELVYLGLSPEFRGRRIGELLVKQAFALAAASNHERLSLAVDSRNVPALKLYYRHGMNRVTSKLAMMRDLRKRS